MEMTAGRITAIIGAALAIAGLAFWGVPYYIGSVVRTQVTAELTAAGITDADQTADANTATLGAILIRLDGMEARMIRRDEFVLNYFKEQADRAAAANQ